MLKTRWCPPDFGVSSVERRRIPTGSKIKINAVRSYDADRFWESLDLSASAGWRT